jgi:hypothetical protein
MSTDISGDTVASIFRVEGTSVKRGGKQNSDSSTLNMEAIYSSEMSVEFQMTI